MRNWDTGIHYVCMGNPCTHLGSISCSLQEQNSARHARARLQSEDLSSQVATDPVGRTLPWAEPGANSDGAHARTHRTTVDSPLADAGDGDGWIYSSESGGGATACGRGGRGAHTLRCRRAPPARDAPPPFPVVRPAPVPRVRDTNPWDVDFVKSNPARKHQTFWLFVYNIIKHGGICRFVAA